MATTQVMKKVIRDYYKIMLVSQTGKGKTYSFRNMKQDSTGFINAELKPLPFNAAFKYHAKPKKFAGVMAALKDYANNPEIDSIVLDSASAAFEILVKELRDNFSGWDVWNNYNKQVGELFDLIKRIEKEIFVTAHYEILNIEGEPEKRVKAKGKEWEGQIEKEFTMVLYANIGYKNGIPEDYYFKLSEQGASAKCPPQIFGEGVYKIPNDSNEVLKKVLEFANKSAITTEEVFQ